jgi:hypothetical protein
MSNDLDTNIVQDLDPATVALPSQPTEVQHLRRIPDGENFSTKTDITGDIVTAVYAIRRSEGGTRYEKKTVFDFSGVSRSDLIALAMYGVKVRTQSILRAVSPEDMLNPATLANVHVQTDFVEGAVGRPKGDPVQNAMRVLAKKAGISEGDLAALILSRTQN